MVGVLNAGLREACAAVNGFLRRRFPSGAWTSIAVLLNPRMGLRRDIQNMPGHLNHALALGDYAGGWVWIEDDEGRWLDMHDKPVSFNMWALAAYVPQAYASLCRATEQRRGSLREAGFPLLQSPILAETD